ncbi:acetyl-CoA carboxylase [Synchytrium microbalum]|uniref:acetyl-CoA carboxylase n=1 Tax=Synchytrium microbalum TaxID=1806994 RepID=A0A507C4W7_9FUNG|nr:acetyl-CoA carboxylase [Synchytrium microbalum]TPX33164.1 acetyl-CoA carboxylase [Synchytrium microbalum]
MSSRISIIRDHLNQPTADYGHAFPNLTSADGAKIQSVLVANRSEIAIRVLRAASELGLRTIAVYSEDDATALHVKKADEAVALPGRGANAYLSIPAMIEAAKKAGAHAIHPGYGFLSENAEFASACIGNGLVFVGPSPNVLDLFGDKVAAKALARKCNVPLLAGTTGPTSLAETEAFMAKHGAVMIKAISGGGGRGMRAVFNKSELAEAYTRCRSEAKASFGRDEVYVEQLLVRPRHCEIQIVGDLSGNVVHMYDRECSLQRRNQKIVEVAPSPSIPASLRDQLIAASIAMAKAAKYSSLGTFEFLVPEGSTNSFYFMEANPRLQVEHTVTEEVLNVDIVQTQLHIARGATLPQLNLAQSQIAPPRGFAIQLRINTETMNESGEAIPTGGTLAAFEPPSGRGVRIDTSGYTGYTTSPAFDSLLAKVIVSSSSRQYADTVAKAYRVLQEFRIEGVETNSGFLCNLLCHPDVIANKVYTTFVVDKIKEITGGSKAHKQFFFTPKLATVGGFGGTPSGDVVQGPAGSIPIPAPMQGTIVSIDVKEGDLVKKGQQIAVMEALKMEHVIASPNPGRVKLIVASKGTTLFSGRPLMFIEPTEAAADDIEEVIKVDLDYIRPDLQALMERQALNLDAARPDAVARRRKTGQRTTRENIEQLVDAGSWIEYGGLTLAAQRARRSYEELLRISPADGMLAGVASINAKLFDEDKSRVVVVAYDYTVFAGTQGKHNHKKKDRIFKLAMDWKLPLILFAEGGGGRPGDSDGWGVAGLDCLTFWDFGKLSGLVPLVGITSGRCFAGNAALLGCCDVIIATEGSNIGMGGPAMIEGGGLGVFTPEEVGPTSIQVPNGVIDVLVKDEVEAVEVAKKYLSYFQGSVKDWKAVDQRILRSMIPENRLRSYDIRAVIRNMCDVDSVLELRPNYGIGILTCLVRIEGRPIGLIANNSKHLGGAIDADAANKAARFMQLCDAYDIAILSLCDTPGFMVGPEAEKSAQVRIFCRMFVTAGSLKVPMFTVVLRKGYGLGAQAMAGGSFHAPFFNVSWQTGEFGGMGLEGAVRLAYRNELAAIKDENERQATFQKMVDESYLKGKAINMAAYLEIDNVIDPSETRMWVVRGMKSVPKRPPAEGKRRPMVDTCTNGTTSFSSSGFVLELANGDSLVLTPAATISPWLDVRKTDAIPQKLTYLSTVEVFVHDDQDEGIPAEFIGIAPVPGVSEAIRKITHTDPWNWQFGFSSDASLADLRSSPGMFNMKNVDIAGIAVLRIAGRLSRDVSARRSSIDHSSVLMGQDVEVIGSPFGVQSPKVFLNSISHGIVSNLVYDGSNIGLIMTDTRILPGVEGGVMLRRKNHCLIGMILPPLKRKDDTTNDLNFGIPISSILAAIAPMLNVMRDKIPIQEAPQWETMDYYIDKAIQSVVLIRIGFTWATGVVVSTAGHIVTNSHVVKPFMNGGKMTADIKVRVNWSGPHPSWISGVKCIFASSMDWDIALLQITGKSNEFLIQTLPYIELPQSDAIPLPDSETIPVYAIGFGQFDPATGLLPTVTYGLQGRLIRGLKPPHNVFRRQSSTTVHNGSSGGLMLGPPNSNGKPTFMGLIVSNLQLESKSSKFTSITFSIPATAFIRIRQYIDTGDYSLLEPLEIEGKEVEELYSVNYKKPLDKKPQSSKLLELLDKEKASKL